MTIYLFIVIYIGLSLPLTGRRRLVGLSAFSRFFLVFFLTQIARSKVWHSGS
ncbi:hypothetical protein HanPSC8_Chr17g0749971 [Helianthus annuus]|nr:hypothetical protein HanPSC8_Chr17g0749971 [Helianthus annuus]